MHEAILWGIPEALWTLSIVNWTKCFMTAIFWGGGSTHKIPVPPMVFLLALGFRQGARDAGDHVDDDAELS